MSEEAEYFISKLYNAFTAYDSIPFGRQNFYHISLSFFGWKLISEMPPGVTGKNGRLLARNTLAHVMGKLNEKNYKEEITQALAACEKNNPAWQGVWTLSSSMFNEVPYKVWLDLGNIWKGFNSELQLTDKQELYIALADELESWMISDLREMTEITPKELVNLMVGYLNEYPGENVYDPCCRSANLLFAAAKNNKQLKSIEGNTPAILLQKFAEVRMLLVNNGAKTQIKKNAEGSISSAGFDFIISNPPFGDLSKEYGLNIGGEWGHYARKSKRIEVAFLCHSLSSLSDRGHAAILLPTIFLSGNGIVGELVKQVLEKNMLEAVIEMPSGLFIHTTIPVVLFLFSKTRKPDAKILLLDATKEIKKHGKSISLNEPALSNRIRQIRAGKILEDEFFCWVSRGEIEEKHFELRQQSYRKKIVGPGKLALSADILRECGQLEDELGRLRQAIQKLVSSKK